MKQNINIIALSFFSLSFLLKAENAESTQIKDSIQTYKYILELTRALGVKDSEKINELCKTNDFDTVMKSNFSSGLWLLAVYTHQTEVIRIFAQTGRVDTQDEHSGDTPLSVAARKGYIDIVSVLLINNPDCFHVTRSYTTPVYDALESGHQECAAVILDYLKNKEQVKNYVEWERALSKVRTLKYGQTKLSNARRANEPKVMERIESLCGPLMTKP